MGGNGGGGSWGEREEICFWGFCFVGVCDMGQTKLWRDQRVTHNPSTLLPHTVNPTHETRNPIHTLKTHSHAHTHSRTLTHTHTYPRILDPESQTTPHALHLSLKSYTKP